MNLSFNPQPKDWQKAHICRECGSRFFPSNHGGKYLFCSNSCSAKYQWRTRKRKPLKTIKKICLQCGKEFELKRYSQTQIANRKFCSNKCCGEYQRINDGLTRDQRMAKRRGSSKRGSPEWIEKIRAGTIKVMNKPDIKEKLKKQRSPLTNEHRALISSSLAGRMPANLMIGNGSYANVQRGEYECSKGTIYFRSKWEANYALFLDFLVKNDEIKSWEYESRIFIFEEIQFGTRSYRPDFEILNNDGSIEFHEVKGYMDSRSKTKLKRMQKYYPEIKLVLIDKTFYLDMVKKFGKILNLY